MKSHARANGRVARHRMPHLRAFQRALAATRGKPAAAALAARMQAHYDAVYAARPSVSHWAMRWHLRMQMLPGLALYRALREDAARRGANPAAALEEAGAVLARLDVLGRWMPLLRYVPGAFAFFRWFFRPVMALYPAAGWDITLVEYSSRRVAFEIRRCFYLDTLTAYGAPELTTHFCGLDDLAYSALPPSIRWERTTTLARGGAYCDFCWRNTAKDTATAEPEQPRQEVAAR